MDASRRNVDGLCHALHAAEAARCALTGKLYDANAPIDEHVSMPVLLGIAALAGKAAKSGDKAPSGASYTKSVDYMGVHFWASDFSGGF